MKMITFSLALMTWFKFSISTPTAEVQEYTHLMKELIMASIRPPGLNRHDQPYSGIRNRDTITIHKVIDGHFAPYDAVEGFLTGTPSEDHHRVQGHLPLIPGQTGEVKVRFGNQNFLYHAALMRKPGYKHKEGNLDRAKYFFTIGRGLVIDSAGILVKSGQLHVPDNVDRVLFVDHLHKNPGYTSYEGRLFLADPVKMRELFASL